MTRLAGKVALITGAGNGMGRAAALLFASEGARVVVADAVEESGNATVDAVRAAGGDASFVRVDVSDEAQVEAMVAFATDTYGALHVVYNNAGIFPADDGGDHPRRRSRRGTASWTSTSRVCGSAASTRSPR